jgi:hypothetical protein
MESISRPEGPLRSALRAQELRQVLKLGTPGVRARRVHAAVLRQGRAALACALWALPVFAMALDADQSALGGLSLAELPDLLRRMPVWVFVLAFVLLPALGFPISLFYLTVSAVFTDPGLALMVALGCMSANMALSYLVARTLSRPVDRLLHRRGYPVPQLTHGAEWRAIVLLRASPLPWLMQSWLLALGGARFLPYMVFGLPVQALVGAGLVLVGGSLFQGNVLWLLVGVSAILLGQAALAGLRRHLRGRGSAY